MLLRETNQAVGDGMTAVPMCRPMNSASPRRVPEPKSCGRAPAGRGLVVAALATAAPGIAIATPAAPLIVRKLRRLMGLPPKRQESQRPKVFDIAVMGVRQP